MADSKITVLTAMLGAEVANTDVFAIVDISIPETKKITRTELFKAIPEIQLESAQPALRFITTGAPATHNTTRIFRSADTLFFQTMAGETAVVNDYALTVDATGAITHSWRISGSERIRLHSNGFFGVGTNAPVVSIDATGDIQTRGTMFVRQAGITSKAAAATLTIAELLTKVILYTGAAATLTAPTGANIIAGLPTSLTNAASFDFSIINTGSGTVTLAGNTDTSLVGAGAVLAATSGLFRVRKIDATTCAIYRMA